MGKTLPVIIMAVFLALFLVVLFNPGQYAPSSFEMLITLALLFINACYVLVSSEQLNVMSKQLRLDEEKLTKFLKEQDGGSIENDQ